MTHDKALKVAREWLETRGFIDGDRENRTCIALLASLIESQRAEAVEEARAEIDFLEWITEVAPETMRAWRESYATQRNVLARLKEASNG